MFSVIYLVFGHIFRLRGGIDDYGVYLLIGIVLWTYFLDATTTTMESLFRRGPLLRKMYFPRLIVPISTLATSTITLLINLTAVAVFVAWNRIVPRLDWLLIVPLLLELTLFAFGIALILATLYVRFRDIGPIWELISQVLFYAVPIIYSLALVDYHSVRVLAVVNPFGQIIEDVRSLVLYDDRNAILTTTDVLGTGARLIPLAIVAAFVAAAMLIFRRDEPTLAERV